MKLTSFFKAFLPEAKVLPRGWRDFRGISPQEQGNNSGITLPMIGSDKGINKHIDIPYLQKMYECHDLVRAPIEMVSSTFGLAKLKVKKKNKDGKYTYLPDHPLQLLLDSPNSSMNSFDLQQAFVHHKLLYGTVGIIVLRKEMHEGEGYVCPECQSVNASCPHDLWKLNKGQITQLMPIHIDRISEKTYKMPDGKTKTFFIYNYGEGQKPIHPNNIITDPKYSSAGSFYGVSPTMNIARWLNLDLAMSEQISAYFMNNAIPSMILNFKGNEQDYGDDIQSTLKAIKEQMMRDYSRRGDGRSAGSSMKAPMLLFGDINSIKIQDPIKDIIQKPLFYEVQSRVALAYNLPRSLFEFGLDYGSQSATVQQQRKDFFNDAIAPELDRFISKIRRYVVPSFNEEGLEVEWDLSLMGVASFLIQERNAIIWKNWEDGLATRNETREALGLPSVTGAEGDEYFRMSLMSDGTNTLSSGVQLTPQVTPQEDNRLKPNRDLIRLLSSNSTT